MSDIMKKTSERSFFIWIDFDDYAYERDESENNFFGPNPCYGGKKIHILQLQETDSGWMAEVEYK